MDNLPESKFYGRRKGRPLTKERAEVIEHLLPVLCVPVSQLNQKGNLDPQSLFPAPRREVWLEVGFGQGEHVKALMERHPDFGFIGAEPFINGMAAFLKSIQSGPHGNIRLLMDDVMLLARSLSDSCLDGMYVLNPDPWHKTRHHKRRIISQENLDVFARILRPGGKLIMSTDVPPLTEWMVTQASMHPDFRWMAECANDWRNPPKGWVTTRYETKGAKGAKRMSYLIFERK